MRNSVVIIVLSIIALYNFLSVGIADTIVIGAEDSWPPYSRADGTGISNTIVQEAYNAVGIDVHFRVAPYARLLREVKQGALLGLFNVSREQSTEESYSFGEERLFQAKTFYYHNIRRPLKAKNLSELDNHERVGLILGYEYGSKILDNTRVVITRVSHQKSLIRMLIYNRIDTAIMFEAIANETFPNVNGSEIIEKAFEGEHSNIYVAFSPKFPNMKYYRDKLDEGLRILKSKGRIKELLP